MENTESQWRFSHRIYCSDADVLQVTPLLIGSFLTIWLAKRFSLIICGGSRGSDHCACLTGRDRKMPCPEATWLFPSIFSPYFFSVNFFPVFFSLYFFSRVFFTMVHGQAFRIINRQPSPRLSPSIRRLGTQWTALWVWTMGVFTSIPVIFEINLHLRQ
jgi:hypothetical protein